MPPLYFIIFICKLQLLEKRETEAFVPLQLVKWEASTNDHLNEFQFLISSICSYYTIVFNNLIGCFETAVVCWSISQDYMIYVMAQA